MKIQKYIRLSDRAIVEAHQYSLENQSDICFVIHMAGENPEIYEANNDIDFRSKGVQHTLMIGEWIVNDGAGNLFSVKQDQFILSFRKI